MGTVVGRSASPERIKEAASKTLTNSRARGGEIQSLAESRLAETVGALDTNEQQLTDARAKDDAAHAALLARDEESDLEIATVGDEIWNGMGRPAQSVDYDLIFAGGKKTWTEGDPAKQPHLMGVLAGNIRNTKHPKLAARKEEWAGRIEKKATAQTEAATMADPIHARLTGLTMQRRSVADLAQLALTRFKRDLKNLGMSEAQIHEIIPDAPAGNGTPVVVPAPAPAPATP